MVSQVLWIWREYHVCQQMESKSRCQQMDIKPNPSSCAYSIDNQPCKRALILIGNFTMYELRHTQRHYTPKYKGVMCLVTNCQSISSWHWCCVLPQLWYATHSMLAMRIVAFKSFPILPGCHIDGDELAGVKFGGGKVDVAVANCGCFSGRSAPSLTVINSSWS